MEPLRLRVRPVAPWAKLMRHARRFAVSTHRQNILQGFELGRSNVDDTMQKPAQPLAQRIGFDTPVIDLIVDLAVQRAMAAGLYKD